MKFICKEYPEGKNSIIHYKVKFERGKASEVTDPMAIRKMSNNPSFEVISASKPKVKATEIKEPFTEESQQASRQVSWVARVWEFLNKPL